MKCLLSVLFVTIVFVAAIVGYAWGRSHVKVHGNTDAVISDKASVPDEPDEPEDTADVRWGLDRIKSSVINRRAYGTVAEEARIVIVDLVINKQDAIYVCFSAKLTVNDRPMELHVVMDQEINQPIRVVSGWLVSDPELVVRQLMSVIETGDEAEVSELLTRLFAVDITMRGSSGHRLQLYYSHIVDVWNRIQSRPDEVKVQTRAGRIPGIHRVSTSVSFLIDHFVLFFSFDGEGVLDSFALEYH